MIRISPFALAGALLATGITVAAAAPSAAERSVRVSYADLDLGSESQRALLDARLNDAISAVCAQQDARDLNGTLACRRATRRQVHADLMPKAGGVRMAMR